MLIKIYCMMKSSHGALSQVSKLYETYIGKTPSFSKDTDKKLEALTGNDFLGSNYLKSFKFNLIHFEFTTSIARLAQKEKKIFFSEYSYKSLVNLVLLEFLEWHKSFNEDDLLQALLVIDKRLRLFKSIFLEENGEKIFNLKVEEKDEFNKTFTKIEDYFSNRKREIDIFDLNRIFKIEWNNLTSEINEYVLSNENVNSEILLNNVKLDFENCSKTKNDVQTIFERLSNSGFLQCRSEQIRQDLSGTIKLFIFQMQMLERSICQFVDSRIKLSEATSDDNSKKQKLDIFLKNFDCVINQKLKTILNLLTWHVSTEEGRLYDLKKFCRNSKFDLHVVQNRLTEETRKETEDYFNPSFDFGFTK